MPLRGETKARAEDGKNVKLFLREPLGMQKGLCGHFGWGFQAEKM